MLLNSKFSNFSILFPRKFFYEEIEEKYDVFFKRSPIVYQNITDYVNYTIQAISWPDIAAETVEQTFKDVIKTSKSGWDAKRFMTRSFDITFRTTEGFLNYWIMYDQFFKYWEYGGNDRMFLPNLNLRIHDHMGYLVMTMIFRNVVFSGISAMELSYSSNMPEPKTFTCTFAHTDIILRNESGGI